MLLEELDGFIAGLLVCPDLIKPSEWLASVWGTENGEAPAFDNIDHLNRVLGLVMEHHNDVARTLIDRPDRYGPLFAVDKRNDEILWEVWSAGFEKTVNCARRPGKNSSSRIRKPLRRCPASSPLPTSTAAIHASQLNSSTL